MCLLIRFPVYTIAILTWIHWISMDHNSVNHYIFIFFMYKEIHKILTNDMNPKSTWLKLTKKRLIRKTRKMCPNVCLPSLISSNISFSMIFLFFLFDCLDPAIYISFLFLCHLKLCFSKCLSERMPFVTDSLWNHCQPVAERWINWLSVVMQYLFYKFHQSL